MGDDIGLNEPFVSISLRMPRPMWEKINQLVGQRAGRDFSDTARNMMEYGVWMYENKKTLNDPEKMKPKIEEFNKRLDEKNSMGWFAQLSDQQLEGIKMVYELERDKRAKNHSN